MTLSEALRSGRPYRLKGNKFWFNPIVEHLKDHMTGFTFSETMSLEWEILDPCVTNQTDSEHCAMGTDLNPQGADPMHNRPYPCPNE